MQFVYETRVHETLWKRFVRGNKKKKWVTNLFNVHIIEKFVCSPGMYYYRHNRPSDSIHNSTVIIYNNLWSVWRITPRISNPDIFPVNIYNTDVWFFFFKYILVSRQWHWSKLLKYTNYWVHKCSSPLKRTTVVRPNGKQS